MIILFILETYIATYRNVCFTKINIRRVIEFSQSDWFGLQFMRIDSNVDVQHILMNNAYHGIMYSMWSSKYVMPSQSIRMWSKKWSKSDQKSDESFSLLSLSIFGGKRIEVMWRKHSTLWVSNMIHRHITANLVLSLHNIQNPEINKK